MKRIITAIAILTVFAGCKNSKALLPSVSGKAGEVIVVTEKTDWEGAIGNEVRSLLGDECPYLVQQEPLYNLIQVTPGGFADIFKVHRNIVLFNIRASVDTVCVSLVSDIWAAPQCVIQINARNSEEALQLFKDNSYRISQSIEQAERDRVIRNSIKYEEKDVTAKVMKAFGGSPRFPVGYKLKKLNGDFAWIGNETQHTNQGIFVYRYPVSDEEPFKLENIIRHRNEILMANVPGMFDGTYMTTSDFFPPLIDNIRFRGRYFTQVRGYWEVYQDYMGGPFASQSFYSPDGKSIIVEEAFVYAPKYDKRQYLRQVESILWSWEWQSSQNINPESSEKE